MKKKNMMTKNLEIFHNKMKISPLNFNCKHYSSCVSRAQNKQNFTKGHGIWIGTEYAKGKVPKLLFLSLDSGSAELDPNKRTMEAAREWNLKWLPGKGDKPKHWYRTQQFAWQVFNELNRAFNTPRDIGNVDGNYDFKPLTEIHKIKPYYAAANSAKCCMNNDRRSQADSILFENCREFILGEFAILDPDILVTQGKYARMVAEKMKIEKILHKENISGASSKEDDFYVIQMNSGKIIVWIHHYHPNNYGTFKKNRDKYKTYAEKTVEFIKNFRKDKTIIFSAKTKKKAELLSDKIIKTNKKEDKKINEVKKNDKPLIHRSGNSLIADFFYNETNYREGKAPEKIVSEMDKLWQKGEYIITIDRLTFNVETVYPELKKELKSVEGKVKKMIGWALSKELITKNGVEIRLLPIKDLGSNLDP